MPQSRIIVCYSVCSSNDAKLQSVYLIRMVLFRMDCSRESTCQDPVVFLFCRFFSLYFNTKYFMQYLNSKFMKCLLLEYVKKLSKYDPAG